MKTLFNTDEHYNLSPLTYPWAFERYKQARKNFWNPEQINMSRDIASFKSLTAPEKEMFLDVFATLTTSDMAIQENLALRIYDLLTPPEIRLWLGHQLADESLHSYSYQHIIECLGLDDTSIYRRYQERPYILGKFTLGNSYADLLKIEYYDRPESLALGLIFFWLAWEGIWFYHGFSPILSLSRRGHMPGTCEQLLYIARDEVSHFNFGLELINTLLDEYNLRGNDAFITNVNKLFEKLNLAEIIYAKHAIPNIAGYSAEQHIEHTQYLINLRLLQTGFKPLYPEAKNALPWLSEMLELKKEKNFFEGHVTEYQSGVKLDFETTQINDILNWK